MKNYTVRLLIGLGLFISFHFSAHAGSTDSISDKLTGDFKEDTIHINYLLRLSYDFITKNAETSLRYAYEANVLSTQLEYSKGMAKAERYIGDDFASEANYPDALKHLLRSLDICDQIDNKLEKAITINDLGEFNMNFRQYGKAIEFYSQALAYAINNKFYNHQILVQSNLAWAYFKNGDFAKSEILAIKTLQQANVENNILLQGDNYRTLGGIDLNRHQFESAKFNFDKALVLYKLGQDNLASLDVLQFIGDIYLAKKDQVNAKRYYNQVLNLGRSFGNTFIISSSYQKLSQVDSMFGNYTEALQNYKKFAHLKDSTESVDKWLQVNKINSHSDLESKQKHIEELIALKNKQELVISFKNYSLMIFSIVIPVLVILGIILLYYYNQKREINKKLLSQKEELQTLNTVKDRLFSIISHDLRSPLANLEAILKLMESGDLSNDEVVILSSQLTQNVHETSNMLDNLLQWSKSQMKGIAPKMEIIDLSILAEEVLVFFESHADKKAIEMKISYCESLRTRADKEMIRLVFRNLVGNAIKFTPTGGEISISIKSEKKEIIISIKDTGIGMNDKTVKKLFSLEAVTTQGTQNEKGTGLGLILCKDFVEINKGKIWAESAVGDGSSFIFTLPLSDKGPAEEYHKEVPSFI